MRRAVDGVTKAEMRRVHRKRRIFQCRQCIIDTRRCIVHGRDIDGHGIGGRVDINAAIRRTAAILYLEPECIIGSTIGIRRRRKAQEGNIRKADQLVCRNRSRCRRADRKAQRAIHGQCRNPHAVQRIGRAVIDIGQAKMSCVEGKNRIFKRRHRVIDP